MIKATTPALQAYDVGREQTKDGRITWFSCPSLIVCITAQHMTKLQKDRLKIE